jgi:hypothetical protein
MASMDSSATSWTYSTTRAMAWGYVSYPPVTPFIARMGLVLFGPSLAGLRFFSALAISSVMVLAGLVTRELSGSRWWLGIGAVIGNSRSDLATAALPVAPINSPWRDVVGGINSFCLRGYGDPLPHVLIVPGSSQ